LSVKQENRLYQFHLQGLGHFLENKLEAVADQQPGDKSNIKNQQELFSLWNCANFTQNLFYDFPALKT